MRRGARGARGRVGLRIADFNPRVALRRGRRGGEPHAELQELVDAGRPTTGDNYPDTGGDKRNRKGYVLQVDAFAGYLYFVEKASYQSGPMDAVHHCVSLTLGLDSTWWFTERGGGLSIRLGLTAAVPFETEYSVSRSVAPNRSEGAAGWLSTPELTIGFAFSIP